MNDSTHPASVDTDDEVDVPDEGEVTEPASEDLGDEADTTTDEAGDEEAAADDGEASAVDGSGEARLELNDATTAALARALAEARTQGQQEARRSFVRGLAGAITMLAVGALITILVLYALGALNPQVLTFLTPTASTEQLGVADGPPAPVPMTAPVAREEPAAEEQQASFVASEQRADPSIISIPAIEMQARVIPLETTAGVLEVPQDFDLAGWWTGGPEPGEVGPAVIVGHVDSYTGPAIFFRLRELKFGDHIQIARADGSRAIFSVTSAFQVDKAEFPTEAVYGTTSQAELRLITCHGEFIDGSYLGNFIVTAQLIDEAAPSTSGILH